MATESSGFDEAMDVGTSTISHLKALKTTSTITKAGFGAAGGPFTAAIGIAIANRHGIAKIIIVIIAILLLPVLFILMLPGLIFGSLMEDTGALNSNTITQMLLTSAFLSGYRMIPFFLFITVLPSDAFSMEKNVLPVQKK